jgi:hypothetical protein
MKSRFVLFAAAVALLSGASIAQASTFNIGTLSTGTYNNIVEDYSTTGGLFTDTITGVLPADEVATFTYTLVGFKPYSTIAPLSDSATYKYKTLGKVYTGSSMSDSSGLQSSTKNSLVLTSANFFNPTAAATITNNSLGNANFVLQLFGKLLKGGAIDVSVTVANLSSVPLPASAPLFGLGLAMVAGLGMAKKRNTQI